MSLFSPASPAHNEASVLCCAVPPGDDQSTGQQMLHLRWLPGQGAGETLLHRPLLPAGSLGLQAAHLHHLLNVLCHQGLVQLRLGN